MKLVLVVLMIVTMIFMFGVGFDISRIVNVLEKITKEKDNTLDSCDSTALVKVADKIVAVKVVTAEFHCKDEKYGIGLLLNSRNDKNKYMVEMNQNDAVSFLKMLYSNGVVDMSEFNAVKIEWTRGW